MQRRPIKTATGGRCSASERWRGGGGMLIVHTINNVALFVILVISLSLVIVHVNQRVAWPPANAKTTTATKIAANMSDLVLVGICKPTSRPVACQQVPARTTRALHSLPLHTDTHTELLVSLCDLDSRSGLTDVQVALLINI